MKPAETEDSQKKDMLTMGDNFKYQLLGGNPISKFFFFNLNKLINSGSRKPYQFDMLYGIDKSYTYEGSYQRFNEFVEANKDAYANNFLGLINKN